MQTRTFDLLSDPFPDATTGASTYAGVGGFANPRNFQLAVDSRVAGFFVVQSAQLVADKYTVVFDRQDTHAGDWVRFAAIVTCDTDEVDAQAPEDMPSASEWADVPAPGVVGLFMPAS